MIRFSLILLFAMANITAFGQLPENMPEQPPAGKTYEALIRQSCARTVDGGYIIYTYCLLAFEKDSVSVAEYSSKNFEDRRILFGKKYSYAVVNNSIAIKRYDMYGTLSLQDGKLTGQQKLTPTQTKEVSFKEMAYNCHVITDIDQL